MTGANDLTAAVRARLTAITAEFSGYAEGDLDPARTFLELGFDSLFLTQLATAFQKEFGVPVVFRQLIVAQPSINELAKHLAETAPVASSVPETPPSAAPSEPEAAPPLPVAEPRNVAPTASADTSDLANVFARQLELMQEQLRLLAASEAQAPQARPANMQAQDAPKPQIEKTPFAHEPSDETPILPAGFGPQAGAAKTSFELTTAQKTHIERLTARYNAKTAGSKARTAADRVHHADPRTAAGFNPLWKEMVYPIVAKRSKGAYIWDVDDNQYIDILNGFGPNFFGHRAPFINDVLKAQLDDGYEIGPQTPRAGDAAKLLCELTGMDRVSWVSTGSEAVQAAIRIARTVTGRDKIVVFKGDYHGNFDEVLVRGVTGADGNPRTMPMAPGIPFASLGNILVLDYGEASALETIRTHAGDIAGVLVEPVQSRRPEFQPREFLHKLRTLTEDQDIVLIFDEVITGFRTCPGGAQEHFGVKADLATYGKIIGGGMPIGVVAGRAKFMDTFDGGQWNYGDASQPTAGVTFFAGTFVRHPMAIAAAHASLAYLKEQGPALQERVSGLAERMAEELNAFFKSRNVKFEVARFASLMFIRNNEPGDLATLFYYHLRDRGVHVLEGFPCYMTAAHTQADVDAIIAAAKDSVLEMQADGLLPRPAGETGATPDFVRRMPLTAGQRVIWSTSQLSERASCAFNESDALHIEGDLECKAFERAVNETIRDYEAFRLRFDSAGADQFEIADAGFELQLVDLSGDDAQSQLDVRLKELALTPFDLERGPLAAALLFRLDARNHVFTLYAHHLIFDGYSSDLFIRDIVRRYRAELSGRSAAPGDVAPFSAYAAKVWGADPVPQFWRELYADGAPPPLALPTDNPRQDQFSYRGSTLRRELSPALCEELRAGARQMGVSVSALSMAACGVLLARQTGQEDMVVGMPAAGQARHGIQAFGYCVNVLPLRVKPGKGRRFSEFANEVQQLSLEAFEHQDMSLSALSHATGALSGRGKRQLIKAVFNFGKYFSGLDAPGVKFSASENRRYAVCHEFFFNLADAGERMIIDLDYASDLFDETTVHRWIDDYTAILADIVRHPECIIGELALGGESGANVVALDPRAARMNTFGSDEPTASPAIFDEKNETQRAILDAAAETFGRDDIEIDANFFDLGGHSIHASRLLTRLRRTVSQSLGLRAIFEAEDLRALAEHIDVLRAKETGGGEREEFVF